MKTNLPLLLILVFAALLFARPASAVVPGQVDDFENGTLMGWSHGVPAYLTNIATGGPAGAGDHYMQLVADGSGQGGRLTTFNLNQWLGNYVGQGITAIEIDLRNEGSTTLSMRLAFKAQNLPNSPGYLSPAMVLAPGSGWQHFSIALTSANLIAIGGPAAFNTFFTSGLGDFRIIQGGATDLNGAFIIGQVAIDNIRAVPEPASIAFLALGALAIFSRRRFLRRA